jgi:benzoylformate decarboxylase
MAEKAGRFAIIEQFLIDGFHYMFGNPGTVEQGFLDALSNYPTLKYILTLQETVAVMAADGYARATQKPALVQIHSTPGLGNAIGALYQAKRGHSPLVVIGGDAGIKYQGMDAQMAGDLVGMAEPVTKWATMVLEPSSLLRVLRRAIRIAGTPPMGPVYVCLPADVLDAPATEKVMPTNIPSTRVLPDDRLLQEAAAVLAAADTPMIFVGDGVAFSGARDELTRVAQLLGAEVWAVDQGEVNMSFQHPLYQGMTGHMFGYDSKPITTKGDVNLVVGTYMVPEVFPELGSIFGPNAQVVHIDLNTYEIGKNHPVDIGMLGDPKLALARLAEILDATMTGRQKDAARSRAAEIGQTKAQKHAAEVEKDKESRDATPLHMSHFVKELAAQLPRDAIVFDEALTNSPPIMRYLPAERTGQYFLTRGGSLGVGIPGAIGLKLANPEKTVIGFTGDGGAMYTIQALWTAARHNVDSKFVICNNSSYRLLQANISAYWKDQSIAPHDFPLSFDLSYPSMHFADIARGMGMQGLRVEKPGEIGPAIQQMLAQPGPFLVDLVLEANVHPELIGVKCGQ